jgi:hypothetical protein
MNPNHANGSKSPNEKNELIDQALQQAVGGGNAFLDLCGAKCSVFGVDVCKISCGISFSLPR